MTYPRSDLRCLALQLAVEAGLPDDDMQWAVRTALDAQGRCHLLPLYIRDVPTYVIAAWDAPLFTPGWAMRPLR